MTITNQSNVGSKLLVGIVIVASFTLLAGVGYRKGVTVMAGPPQAGNSTYVVVQGKPGFDAAGVDPASIALAGKRLGNRAGTSLKDFNGDGQGLDYHAGAHL